MIFSDFKSSDWHRTPYLFEKTQNILRELEREGKSHSAKDRTLGTQLREILLTKASESISGPSKILAEKNSNGISIQDWLLENGYPRALLETLEFYDVQNLGKPEPGNVLTRAIELGRYKSFLVLAEYYTEDLRYQLNIEFGGYNGVLDAIEQNGRFSNRNTLEALLICLKNLSGHSDEGVIQRLHKRVVKAESAAKQDLGLYQQKLIELKTLANGNNESNDYFQGLTPLQKTKKPLNENSLSASSLKRISNNKIESEVERLKSILQLIEGCHARIKKQLAKQSLDCCEYETNHARLIKQSRQLR